MSISDIASAVKFLLGRNPPIPRFWWFQPLSQCSDKSKCQNAGFLTANATRQSPRCLHGFPVQL